MQRAREKYRVGDLAGALDIVDGQVAILAMRRKQPQLFEFLELQALLLEKLGRLDGAARSAAALIKLNSTDARGYLRAARVCVLAEQPSKAVKFYRMGLINVPKDCSLYPMLRRLERQVCAKARQKCLDPFSHLPHELLLMVLAFVVESARDLANLTLVSRTWHARVCSEPRLWQTLSFPAKSRPPSIDTLVKYMRRAQSQACSLELRCPVMHPKKLASELPRSTVALSIVRHEFPASLVYNLPFLSTLRICSKQVDKDLVRILASFPQLRLLELRQSGPPLLEATALPSTLPPLEYLRIHGVSGAPCFTESLVEQIVSIRTLRALYLMHAVHQFAGEPFLVRNSTTEFGFMSCSYQSLPWGVSELAISGPLERLILNQIRIAAPELPAQMPVPLRYLELKMTEFEGLALDDVLSRFNCSSTLETLVLHKSVLEPLVSPKALYFPNLKSLELTAGCGLIDNTIATWIVQCMPALVSININDTSSDPYAVAQLVKLCPLLKLIRCRGCSMSPETVDWVRKSGVVIKFI